MYISTDSVYDASQATLAEDPYKGFQEAGIPEPMGFIEKEKLTPEQLKKLKKQDSYGFKKLLAETLIIKTHPRVLSLRLADVLGPFDETFRLWRLVLWAMHSTEVYPLQLDERAMTHKLSFTAS